MRHLLHLANDLDEVARLNDWFGAVATAAGASRRAAEDARLCLNELVANVISYGYPEGGSGHIDVAVEARGERLAVEIVDDGIPFDPLAGPTASPMTGLEDARIGGFGLKLVRETAQELRHARSDGRNRLSFVCG